MGAVVRAFACCTSFSRQKMGHGISYWYTNLRMASSAWPAFMVLNQRTRQSLLSIQMCRRIRSFNPWRFECTVPWVNFNVKSSLVAVPVVFLGGHIVVGVLSECGWGGGDLLLVLVASGREICRLGHLKVRESLRAGYAIPLGPLVFPANLQWCGIHSLGQLKGSFYRAVW